MQIQAICLLTINITSWITENISKFSLWCGQTPSQRISESCTHQVLNLLMNEWVNWLRNKQNVIYYSADHIKAFFKKGLSTLPLVSPQPVIGSTLKTTKLYFCYTGQWLNPLNLFISHSYIYMLNSLTYLYVNVSHQKQIYICNIIQLLHFSDNYFWNGYSCGISVYSKGIRQNNNEKVR